MIMSAVDVDLSQKKVPVFTLSHVWQHLKLSAFSLGVYLQYGQVVDEDVKKPTNQPQEVLVHLTAYATVLIFSYFR